MSTIRVLFVTTRMEVGGAERLLADLVTRLDHARFEPVLVCLRELGPMGEQLLSRGVRTYASLASGGRDVTVLRKLVHVMRQERAQVVCTVGTGGDRSFWGRLAARAARVPVVISCPHSMGRPDRFEIANRFLSAITDAFIAVARRQKRYLVHAYGLPAGKIRVVYNGVDLRRFAPGSPPAEVRAALRLPADAPVATLVARLRPEKNVTLFLRAACRVREILPAARFVIVGDGPMREQLIALARTLGIADRVHFAGLHNQVELILQASNVLALSSSFEAFPLTILEAMACGKPVVATDVGAVREMVTHGQTGFLVSPGNETAMARSLVRILSETPLADEMGRRGRRVVEDRFGLDSMVNRYQDIFEQLLARRRHAVNQGSKLCRCD